MDVSFFGSNYLEVKRSYFENSSKNVMCYPVVYAVGHSENARVFTSKFKALIAQGISNFILHEDTCTVPLARFE